MQVHPRAVSQTVPVCALSIVWPLYSYDIVDAKWENYYASSDLRITAASVWCGGRGRHSASAALMHSTTFNTQYARQAND
jgi:hypothetical protein